MVSDFFIKQLFKSLIFSYQRLFIVFLAIFVGALISSAFLNVYFDIDTKLSKELKAYGANLTFFPAKEGQKIPNEVFLEAKDELQARALTPYLYDFLSVQGSKTLVLGTDFRDLKLTKPFIELRAGSFSLNDFKPDSAFIGLDLALRLISGKKGESLEGLINQKIELYNEENSKRASFIIKGILQSNDELDSLFLISLESLQALNGVNTIDYANALLYGSFDEVQTKARKISNEMLFAKPISSVSLSEGLVLDKLKALMFLIILVVLIIASTSVNTTLSSVIFSRKKEIALQIALGASKKDIIKLFGLECFILALLGSILGTLCGIFLADIFGLIIFNASIDTRFLALVISVLLSLTFAFFAAFMPIKKALKISVCENLRGE